MFAQQERQLRELRIEKSQLEANWAASKAMYADCSMNKDILEVTHHVDGSSLSVQQTTLIDTQAEKNILQSIASTLKRRLAETVDTGLVFENSFAQRKFEEL